jgi:hypothetical protein
MIFAITVSTSASLGWAGGNFLHTICANSGSAKSIRFFYNKNLVHFQVLLIFEAI